jgi:hypothetical protein
MSKDAPENSAPSELDPPEPRWPAIVAILATAGLVAALPSTMVIFPRTYEAIIILVLVVPLTISHHLAWHRTNVILGHVLSGVMTLFLITSLALLIQAIPRHTETPAAMLRSAACLWVTNVLVFALWYWRLDAGGPRGRDQRLGHPDGAFLFPQMALAATDAPKTPKEQARKEFPWSPQFVDYLFLAFNTSTAFSPTDAPILSRWAKVLTMIQSMISLAIVALLAARAVNIF